MVTLKKWFFCAGHNQAIPRDSRDSKRTWEQLGLWLVIIITTSNHQKLRERERGKEKLMYIYIYSHMFNVHINLNPITTVAYSLEHPKYQHVCGQSISCTWTWFAYKCGWHVDGHSHDYSRPGCGLFSSVSIRSHSKNGLPARSSWGRKPKLRQLGLRTVVSPPSCEFCWDWRLRLKQGTEGGLNVD